METKLMPIDRLATIIADAAVRAATNVTGFFRNERMTWSEQGVHAAAWNAIRHDPEVQNALKMVAIDGITEYESNRPASLVVTTEPASMTIPIPALLLLAGKSGNPSVVLEALRQAWMSPSFAGPSEKFDHEQAFNQMVEHLRGQHA